MSFALRNDGACPQSIAAFIVEELALIATSAVQSLECLATKQADMEQMLAAASARLDTLASEQKRTQQMVT